MGIRRSIYGLSSATTAPTVLAPTGVAATDTANIQAAIDAGGEQVLRAGTYVVTGLTAKTLSALRGQGKRRTIIQLAAGANTDVVKSLNFDTLTGTDSNAGIYGFKLAGLTIDGNKANNSSGYGVRLYGYEPTLDDVEIYNCAGVGLYSEWGATQNVSSDTLATGSMEGKVLNCKIHRNAGGGINWQGPSDSVFTANMVAKNGPATSTTTVGFKVGGAGVGAQIADCHIWGNLHNIGIQADVQVYLTDVEVEGAITDQIWLRSHGNVIVGGRCYFPGTSLAGLKIGDAGAVVDSADNFVTGLKLTGCGILFDKDGGTSTYNVHVYWADASKTVLMGTQSPSQANRFNVKVNGGAAHGAITSLSDQVAVKTDIPGLRAFNYPAGCVGASIYDKSNIIFSAIAVLATGRLHLVRIPVFAGDVISHVNWIIGGTAGATLTHNWSAIYDVTTLGKLAISADNTSASITAAAVLTHDLTVPYTVPRGVTAVYAAINVTGTTMPTHEGIQFLQTGGLTVSPAISGPSTTTGLTDPTSAPSTCGAISLASSKVPAVYLT